MPHMAQVDWSLEGEHVIISGRRYVQGFASSISSNCLIDTLREKLNIIANVALIRRYLMAMLPAGHSQVAAPIFLTPSYHWRAVIDSLFRYDMSGKPKLTHSHIQIVCVDVSYAGNGEAVGTGHMTLHLAKIGTNHFTPLIARI